MTGICSVENCGGKTSARGLCNKHYLRLQKRGTTNDPVPNKDKTCSVDGCSSVVYSMGFCRNHYERYRRSGDTNISVYDNRSKRTEYSIWVKFIHKCHNPKDHQYEMYGAMGFTVCDRWRNSFWDFIEDVGPRPSDEHCLLRRDKTKGYSPENCYWGLNKNGASRRWKITREVVEDIRENWSGQPLKVVAEQFGISMSTVSRIRSGERWGRR